MLTKLSLYVALAAATLCLQIGLDLPTSELFFARGWTGAPVYVDCVMGIGIGVVLVFISRVASWRFTWTRRLDNEFRDILGPLTHRDIMILALMSSITEELFFRGFLQAQIGLESAALIFGLAHFPYRRFLIPWTLTAILVGWFFGWIFEARNCLIAPIVAHFVVNYFNLHYILRPRVDDQLAGAHVMPKSSLAPRHGQAWKNTNPSLSSANEANGSE